VLIIRFLLSSVIILAAVFFAARLGLFAGKPPGPLGIRDGKLAPPRGGYSNSVASQHNNNDYHAIAPLQFSGDAQSAMGRLRDIVGAMNGSSIIESNDSYLYAQFTTFFMRYVDDVEFMIDREKSLIHVRSASRLGRKDFGVNRERIEAIRQQFEK
jgi:uncharacterized protein (DUF1499 family)